MERGLHTSTRRWLGAGLAALCLAGTALAQDASEDREFDTATVDDIAEAADFAEAFEAFAEDPPLYQPGDADHAVDLTQIEPERGPRIVRDLGTGTASFYGKRFHGRTTANGERFDMHAMTAAHRTLPFGSKVRVTNPRNGKQVIVRINDRGPFAKGRAIDLSRAAAEEIGMIRRGHARVEMELVE
ncbi:septal ring lytic transglycosylase RlpA family protein [Altererythrobacter lutimaris]|uniref:Endolytic peptidoglycan transglycosylase RlpA n=1 Tax=Altererythrobacter lutimaris TaxID=2743979 RepID=A0A850HBY8_9SPHN|nr:septal ring lytic transglycosylase RlpA family protein [Altererythrobacter lutimaris]NVE94108.1 septal ring lytic transglycosylase RlpA family protein [Altererythrobacter lutimaris]